MEPLATGRGPVGIVCATDGEVAPFWERMQCRSTACRAMREFRLGTLGGADVVVTCTGVGKANATMGTQMLLDDFEVSCVINAGAAGAVDAGLGLFDIVVTTECVHHDVPHFVLDDSYPYYDSAVFASDEGLIKAARLAAARCEVPFVFGRTATGECFVDDSNRDAIQASCAPLAVDMETAAMAQTCTANGVPFIALRCITDTPALSGFDSYAEHADEASERACDAVELMLSAMAAGR